MEFLQCLDHEKKTKHLIQIEIHREKKIFMLKRLKYNNGQLLN